MRFFALAALALAAVACRAGRPGAARADGATTVTDANPFRAELLLEPRARAGEPVRFRLRVENVSGSAADLYLRGRSATFDVVVRRAQGGVVWRRLEGEIIPAIVRLQPLGPGQRLETEAVWDQRGNDGKPVGPGEYVVEGSLLLEDASLPAPPRPLTIAPR